MFDNLKIFKLMMEVFLILKIIFFQFNPSWANSTEVICNWYFFWQNILEKIASSYKLESWILNLTIRLMNGCAVTSENYRDGRCLSIFHTHLHIHFISLSHTLALSLSLSHTHKHTLSLSHSRIGRKHKHLHLHTHYISLSHTRTQTHTISLSNSFIGRKHKHA